MCTFATFWAGLYTRQADIQDRLMCSSCAIISSIHSAEHECRNSTSVCSIHDFPYNKLNKKSLLQAAAILFESGLCVGMQLQKCGFYSRASSIQWWLLYKTLRYAKTIQPCTASAGLYLVQVCNTVCVHCRWAVYCRMRRIVSSTAH